MFRFPATWLPLTVQLLLMAAAFAWIGFAPPASGNVLLVPLNAGAAARLPALALGEGALLLGQGPVAGSLVVRREHIWNFGPLLDAAVLPIAAPATGCGRPNGV